jgi:hypothetical protein
MNRLLSVWLTITLSALILTALAEISLRALRIGRLRPEIKTCPWSAVPRQIWACMTDNHIHLFEWLSSRRKQPAHDELDSSPTVD